MMHAARHTIAVLSAVLATATSAIAQMPTPGTPRARQAAPSNVTVYLLTMGVGRQVWELFGHDALWFHDPSTGTDEVYDWGRFSFRQPNFIGRFLKGHMLYTMGGTTIDTTIWEYTYFRRKVTAQQLDLTPAQIQSMHDYIAWNMRPGNQEYRYDYYRDNCTTRIRDIIDRALGGQLRAASTTQRSGTTYRLETLRLMRPDFWLASGVDIGLGQRADSELSRWDDMFLPWVLHDFLRTFKVRDSTGAGHPLVKSERVLLDGQEPAAGPATPPPIMGWLLPLGLGVAIVLAIVLALAPRARGWRIAAAILVSAWAAIAGILGLLLTLLWTVTDHVFAHSNASLLVFHPLWLVLAVLLPISIVRGRAERATRAIVGLTVAAAAVALVLRVTGFSAQQNLAVIWLALPSSFVIGAVAFRRQSASAA